MLINISDRKVILEAMVLPTIEDIKNQFKVDGEITLIVKQETKTTLSTFLVVGGWVSKLDVQVDGFKTKIKDGVVLFTLSKKQNIEEYLKYLEKALVIAMGMMEEKLNIRINQSEFNLFQHSRNNDLVLLSKTKTVAM